MNNRSLDSSHLPFGWSRRLASLLLMLAALAAQVQGNPIISEFMAGNDESLVLSDGTSPDWIEIYNPGTNPLELGGWFLSDDAADPTRWSFPDGVTIPAGGYLIVFATGDNLRDPTSDLHTNFRLTTAGEYLGIINSLGEIVHEYSPSFPKQFEDISYGLTSGSNTPAYFTSPTPGAVNNSSTLGFVEDTKFSVNRGFFDEPFTVEVTSATPGASIYYTTDGSNPDLQSPRVDATSPDALPSLSVQISNTTILRAFAGKPGFESTNIDTQTYLFLDQVIGQSTMSNIITDHPIWGPQMHEALLEIPTISLITQEEIPVNQPSIENPREIPLSIEMIYPDAREGFQVNAGVERFGGQYSIFNGNKKALRISFKEIYGPKRLNFNLFDDVEYGSETAVDSFDQLLLRNGSHDAIFHEGYARPRNGAFVRNRYYLDRQFEMGHHSLRGKFVHVYLNGDYYGHYHLMERPTADHMAEYFGGEEEDYDLIRGRSGLEYQSGSLAAWNTLVADSGNWEIVQQYLDVDNYIDYMLLNFYGGNDHDWYPNHNWVAARRRDESGRFRFFMWDSDFLNRARLPDGGNTVNNGGPSNILNGLKTIPEFRRRMADRAQKHFLNGGVLSRDKVNADFNDFGSQLARTIIPETARWGNQNSSFYTPDTFQNAIDWLATDYPDGNLRPRVQTVLQQMRDENLFPDTDAPVFSQHGGEISPDFPLMITHTDGSLYYTTDGSDPLLPGGDINPEAQLVEANTVAVPAGSNWKYDDSPTDHGTTWLALEFDDSAWNEGGAPLGYGRITNTTLATQINSTIPRELSVYFRKSFQINNADSIGLGIVELHADGGAVVNINGTEVLRDNIPAGPITKETASITDGNEGTFDFFTFDGSLLVEGENLIAVSLHNQSAGSSDMVFDLKLSYESANRTATVPLSGTQHVKARVLDEGEWSALTEAVFVGDQPATSSNLVISEIHYHPNEEQGADSEFIELMNISEQTISLAGVSFTEGISFTFEDQITLGRDETIVVVSDKAAFEANYGVGFLIGGIYTSRLANNGERITLTGADDIVIQSLRFNDRSPWPTEADGTGRSLTLTSPRSNPDPSLPQSWRTSLEVGGSPLLQDSFPGDIQSSNDILYSVTGSEAPVLTKINDQLVFEHQRLHGADYVTFVIEYSTDLENWSSEGLTFLDQTNTGIGSSGFPGSKLSWSLPSGLGERVFTRIRATLID